MEMSELQGALTLLSGLDELFETSCLEECCVVPNEVRKLHECEFRGHGFNESDFASDEGC